MNLVGEQFLAAIGLGSPLRRRLQSIERVRKAPRRGLD